MAGQVRDCARRFAIVALVLVVLGLSAPIAAAAHRRANGVGLGNPSADANAPQIPAQANVKAVRAWIERAISVRLVALREFHAAATARSALTTSDRSLIVAQIATDRAGLDALAKSVPADTTVPQLQDAIDARHHELSRLYRRRPPGGNGDPARRLRGGCGAPSADRGEDLRSGRDLRTRSAIRARPSRPTRLLCPRCRQRTACCSPRTLLFSRLSRRRTRKRHRRLRRHNKRSPLPARTSRRRSTISTRSCCFSVRSSAR